MEIKEAIKKANGEIVPALFFITGLAITLSVIILPMVGIFYLAEKFSNWFYLLIIIDVWLLNIFFNLIYD